MKIAYITTKFHNSGDGFILSGVEFLMRCFWPDHGAVYINKHDPRTIYETFPLDGRSRAPHRLVAPLLMSLYEAFARPGPDRDKLLAADLVVFAGTPFIWRHSVKWFPSTCANAEWVRPVWKRLDRIAGRVPVLNLAAGSDIHGDAEEELLLGDRSCTDSLRNALSRCILTTARDRKAQSIIARLGFPVPLIPCPSIFSGLASGIARGEPSYVALNFLPNGGRPKRSAKAADLREWRRCFIRVFEHVRGKYDYRFICHTERESTEALAFTDRGKIVYSADFREILSAYSRALAGIVGRVHGAMALANFGRPGIIISHGTRSLIAEDAGIRRIEVQDADSDRIIGLFEDIVRKPLYSEAEARVRQGAAIGAYLDCISGKLHVPVRARPDICPA